MFKSIKRGIRTVAHRHRQLLEPAISAIGVHSDDAEKAIRRKLHLYPSLVKITRSPAGPLLSSQIRMNTFDGRDQIARAVYHKGWAAFEFPLASLLAGVLSSERDGPFFDIGANTGLYSLLSKSICPDRDVYAFEPFPPVLAILKSNIALNSFAADIVVVSAAACDEVGAAELFIPTREHGLVETSASLCSSFRSPHSEIVTVQTVRLDDYQQADRGSVSVIKVDVEGAEDRVLKGAAGIMASDQPIIFCEILPNSSAWQTIPQLLAKHGYVRAAIHTRSIVRQKGSDPDFHANNYVLFPERLERFLCDVANSVGVAFKA